MFFLINQEFTNPLSARYCEDDPLGVLHITKEEVELEGHCYSEKRFMLY
jgi:hypothetical protein